MVAEHRSSQISLLLTALLIGTTSISVVSGQPTGVNLTLNGVTIPSDGYVLVTDIGAYASGLYCNTDRIDCCRASDASDGLAQGHWYFPDGTQVGSFTQESAYDPSRNFFSRDRLTGVVRLNRQGNPPWRGHFFCVVPNAAGVYVIMYVNIVDSIPPTISGPFITTHSQSLTTEPAIETVMITTTANPLPPVTVTIFPITSSGAATAGESYRLECAVTVTGSNDQPTITWLMGPVDNMITSRVVTTGSMSTLTFNPLAASHAGTYTCRATLGSAMDSASTTITVQNPTIIVRVSSSVATPILGSMYSLTCTVTGAEGLIDAGAMVTYQWLKDGAVVSGQTKATLSFSPLTYSDAGSYSCRGTIISSLLSVPISQNSTNATSINNINPMLPAVYLYLRGQIHISNSSYIDIDDIGEGDEAALICVTDLTQCCRVGVDTHGDTVLGRWFYPNGTDVPVAGEGYHDVYSSRGPSIVLINRRNNIRSPTGLYCCEVSDATNTLLKVCANIGARALSEEPCAISFSSGANVGISVGTLLLVEGVIAVVITVVMVSCYFGVIRRRRKSSEKSVDFAVSANMAYGEVRLEDLGDVGEKYEDPDKLAKSGRGGGGSEGNYELTECPAPYVSKPEAPVYATADDTTNCGCGKITA